MVPVSTARMISRMAFSKNSAYVSGHLQGPLKAPRSKAMRHVQKKVGLGCVVCRLHDHGFVDAMFLQRRREDVAGQCREVGSENSGVGIWLLPFDDDRSRVSRFHRFDDAERNGSLLYAREDASHHASGRCGGAERALASCVQLAKHTRRDADCGGAWMALRPSEASTSSIQARSGSGTIQSGARNPRIG